MIHLPTFDDICAIIVTRGDVSLDHIISTLPYGELLLRRPTYTTHYRLREGSHHFIGRYEHDDQKILGRYLAMGHTEKPIIYFQDDDIVFTEHEALLAAYEPGKLIANMGQDWINAQSYHDLALVGLGSLIDNGISMAYLDRYRGAFPDDDRFLIDADFAHGVLVPQKKVDLGAEVLEVAVAPNRLSLQADQMDGKWRTIRQARTLRKVVLTMLMKNEREHVVNALESAAELFDSLLIHDTGSTDGSQLEVARWCSANGIPFEIVDRPWVNMEHNRNELLVEGRKRADYLLLMDCDETLINRPPAWEHLAAHAYFLHYAGEIDYAQPRLLWRDYPWYFEGLSHAALTCEGDTAVCLDLQQPLVDHHGWHRNGVEKWQRDVELLTRDLENGVDVPRCFFMRGKAYEGLGMWDEAIADYTARLELSQGDEEAYYARFRLGCLLVEKRHEFLQGLDQLVLAWTERPGRAESLRAAVAYTTAVADSIPYPTGDKVIVHRAAYGPQIKEA